MPCLRARRAIVPAPLAGDFGPATTGYRLSIRAEAFIRLICIVEIVLAADRSKPSGFIVVGRMKKATT